MTVSSIQDYLAERGAAWLPGSDRVEIDHFGDSEAELQALEQTVGLLDLSTRHRLCLVGNGRVRFLHGQVTNDVQGLVVGQGCYAALLDARGRVQSDLHAYVLAEELLLDLEPGAAEPVARRLRQFIIAEDVQVVDVTAAYGCLSVQGPRAGDIGAGLALEGPVPRADHEIAIVRKDPAGEILAACIPRFGSAGIDFFAPAPLLPGFAAELESAVRAVQGRWCGRRACEWTRIDRAIPRFGVDMDPTTLAPEAGIESRAISYRKGCYIGQEVIARIRTYGRVARVLRQLRMPGTPQPTPAPGATLWHGGKEVGRLTSSAQLPGARGWVGLGYVRRECNAPGTRLLLNAGGQGPEVEIAAPAFG
jgi:tRNA-modifying protein YgfZ